MKYSKVIMTLCASLVTIMFTADQGHADQAALSNVDALSAGFNAPPDSARPRVWWHWMNGNITKDGIAKDLQWMQRVGIGGVQNFDAAKNTPLVVDKRLVYMSAEWQDAFRHAVQLADQLGLEFGIASSPGWSETGGPWVEPKDAMKKLVWSELTLQGRKHFKGQLPVPPSVTGPYQNIPARVQPNAAPSFYGDSIVLAYRDDAADELPAPVATVNGKPIAAGGLLDGNPSTGIPLPVAVQAAPGTLQYSYAKPHTVRSVHVYIHNFNTGNPYAAPLILRLEASDDADTWQKLADIRITNVPSTASFAPATARHFRLVFTRGTPRKLVGIAATPGVDPAAAMSTSAVASPSPMMAAFELSTSKSVNAFEQKAGFAIADNYEVLDESVDVATGIAPDSVIDLTSRFHDGVLDWTPPAGHWRVLRFGYSLTGKTNAPATAEATGLEVDKYDGAAVESYLNTYFGMYRDATGANLFGKKGVNCLVNDSIEAGAANWTPLMLDRFKQLRGYDAHPWLPALAGKLVGTREQSDAFLYDFRRTLSDLMATEHYGTIAKVAHQEGLTVYGESLEGTRATFGDDIEMRKYADIPMAALWAFKQAPRANLVMDLRGAASTAHIYGRSLVAAESLTSVMAPWAFAPADLQPMIDAEFANGVNRPVIHTSVHQPLDDKVPGLSLEIYGQHFTRHETWAEMAAPWVTYLARNSYMLQQGRNVADVAYFYGEDTPVGAQAEDGHLSDVPKRYAYDFLSPDALLNDVSVQDAEIVTKGGARYRAIYLGGQSKRMTGAVLRRIAALADAGATIIGAAPDSSLGLKDDPKEFSQIVKRLWGGAHSTKVGAGQVIATNNIEEALASINVLPDFSYTSAHNDSQLLFVHRRLTEGELYFVTNRVDRAERVDARFRVAGKIPEIWHADTGKKERVSYRIEGHETIVPLEMGSQESLFVVFRESAAASFATFARPAIKTMAEIDGSWQVSFQQGRGAPETLRLNGLLSLADVKDPGVKYFSGISTYTNSFVLPKTVKLGSSLIIDLGRVGDVAEVRVNGKLAGTAWKPPYQVDIGSLVRRGNNSLEIRVVNLWVNRLIGDAQPGAKKIASTTLPTYTAKAPLRASGLMGPVTLVRPEF